MAGEKSATMSSLKKGRPSCASLSRDVKDWFMNFTSIGGLSQINSDDLTVSKVFWIILFIAGMVMTMIGFIQVVLDIFSYGVVTTVTLEQKSSIPFPAVTICNQNRVHCANLYNVIQACETASCSRRDTYCKIYHVTGCAISVIVAEDFFYGTKSSPVCAGLDYSSNYSVVTEGVFMTEYSQLTPEEARSIAHYPDQMIKRCTFEGAPDTPLCNDIMNDNATSFFNPRYGYCYSYNYHPIQGGKGLTPVHCTFPGPVLGLDLELDIEDKYYMRNGLTQQAGARIIIHEPDGTPLLSSSGYDILPNTATSLGLRMINITRAPPPYTSMCIDYWNQTSGIQYTFEQFRYQAQLCRAMCIHEMIMDECGCSMSEIAELSWVNTTFCNDANLACIAEFGNQLGQTSDPTSGKKEDFCPCTPECYEKQYLTTISTTQWPSNNYWAYLAQIYNFKFQNNTITASLANELETNSSLLAVYGEVFEKVKNHVQETMVKIRIFYDTKSVEGVTEDPKYSASSVVSSIGGAISLYLGISLVSIFEVVDIIIHCVMYGMGKRW